MTSEAMQKSSYKDHLVEPEDVMSDSVFESTAINRHGDIEYDHQRLLDEIHSRSEKARIDLAYEILGAESREQFESMMHKLYEKGTK